MRFVGKFRPRLIELTSFKPKLSIRFIRNKTCKNKQTSISCQNHATEKINKTRYDDPGKPMKQTSFTVKNLGGNLPKKQSTIVKRNFRSSAKPLSLDSTIPVDELTAETFYCFKTSELFNIWMPPFLLHGSQYVTNSPTWRRLLVAKFFTSSTMKIKKQLVTKPWGTKMR